MNPVMQGVFLSVSILSTIFTALVFFVLRDMRDRIARLEDRAMDAPRARAASAE
jgi:hypothetical protein